MSKDYQNIPKELRDRDQWICWREENRDGKATKIPVCARTGRLASVTNPADYATFAEACDYAGRTDEPGGIGFVFTDGDPYTGIDIDDCANPDTGDVDMWALHEVLALSSYAELSPSGSGVHVILEGTPPNRTGRKRGSRECYFSGRFFTMTGKTLGVAPSVKPRQEQLEAWHATAFPPQDRQPPKTWSHPTTASDTELFRRIERSKQGAKFGRLWRGDTSDFAGDDSAADLALCSMLYWWTGGDSERVDRLFRASGLMRAKWDSPRRETTYGGLTILRAAQQSSVYQSEPEAAPQPVADWSATPTPPVPTVAGEPTKKAKPFRWLRELEAPKQIEKWVWRGYLARNSITLLSAYWKAGKTTLLTHLLKQCESGGELFGEPVEPTTVLYISEEHERLWYDRREGLHLDEQRDTTGLITQPFKSRSTMLQWSELIQNVTEAVKEYGFTLVIFDTLGKLWPVREENDSAGVDEALMPLWRIAEAGAAVLLVHHMRKGKGDEFTAARGSGSLSAFPEILVELSRHDPQSKTDRKRKLSAIGRYAETPIERIAELTEGGYVTIDDRASDDSASVKLDKTRHLSDNILAVIGEFPGMTTEWIREKLRDRGLQFGNDDVSAGIARLFALGDIGHTGKIRSKTEPRRWYLASHPVVRSPECSDGRHEMIEDDGDPN